MHRRAGLYPPRFFPARRFGLILPELRRTAYCSRRFFLVSSGMAKSIRPIRTKGALAFIPLTQGYTATIDAADVHLVEAWNWSALVVRNTVYAKRREMSGGKQRTILLHRVIMDPPDDMQVDHISGDGLDCRRSNMRQATNSQNQHNQRISRNNTSGFKGVSWQASREKWQANIMVRGKHIYLGRFALPESAHAAYRKASARLHGKFGRAA